MSRSALLVVVAFVGGIGPASAGPKETQDRARVLFEAGQKSFDAEDYGPALRYFTDAYELEPHDAVRFNMAVCLERLGRLRHAVEAYQAIVKSRQLTPQQRAIARSKQDELRGRLGTVTVTAGDVDGAEVSLAGETLCQTPCTVDIEPGLHRIRVVSGERRGEAEVRVDTKKESRVDVELVEPPPPEVAPTFVVERQGPGIVTWAGAGVAAAGLAGVVGFGLWTRSLHDDYLDEPTPDLQDRGETARLLTNVSLGVGVAGLVAVAVDVLIFARRERRVPVRAAVTLESASLRVDF